MAYSQNKHKLKIFLDPFLWCGRKMDENELEQPASVT